MAKKRGLKEQVFIEIAGCGYVQNLIHSASCSNIYSGACEIRK